MQLNLQVKYSTNHYNQLCFAHAAIQHNNGVRVETEVCSSTNGHFDRDCELCAEEREHRQIISYEEEMAQLIALEAKRVEHQERMRRERIEAEPLIRIERRLKRNAQISGILKQDESLF